MSDNDEKRRDSRIDTKSQNTGRCKQRGKDLMLFLQFFTIQQIDIFVQRKFQSSPTMFSLCNKANLLCAPDEFVWDVGNSSSVKL